jgi:hypothetical protein
MLRAILLAAVTIGAMVSSVPAFAEFCFDWCSANRCAHGVVSQPACMNKCLPACRAKHAK